jgi:hypothetical protein
MKTLKIEYPQAVELWRGKQQAGNKMNKRSRTNSIKTSQKVGGLCVVQTVTVEQLEASYINASQKADGLRVAQTATVTLCQV